MKKLSLLFFAVCASVMSWAADALLQANPFAYDLKSEVIENGTQLKLTYSLNATAVTSDTYNEDHHGLQIYLIDENGNRIKKEDGTPWVCTSGSYQKGKDHSVIIPIADLPPAAKDRPISWEVVVHGNKNRTKPKMVDDYYPTSASTPKDNYKPRASHGIAVDKDPQSKWFGRIFVAEACTNTTGKSSVLEYDMLLNYRTFHHKDILDGSSSYFSSAINNEPHRVKISEDGRMFATCYHPNAISAVLEYMGNGEWKTVVEANTTVNQYQDEVIYGFDHKYNRRPIAMDVKGEGENLKILVAWMKPKGKKINDNLFAQIQCIEYNVGKNKYKLDQDNDGTIIAEYLDHAINESGTSPHGMLFNSYRLDYNQAKHGFVDVAYGDNGSIWLKVDFGFGVSEGRRSHIIRFDEGSIEPKYTYTFPSTSKYRSDGGYYGGSGLFVKGNQLITGSGASTILAYKIKADKTLDETDSNILSISTGSPGTKTWTNAIAEDYAGNLYCVSDTADNIIVVAMPYDGTRITRAPASQSIVLSDPVPNILATDLRCEPHATQNKYIFSFNTNTKPEEAQIRFYESYEDMQKSLNVVNADNYNGTNANKPAFVYNIPDGKLKQGRIEVELGGVCGKLDANNVIINDSLPAGVLYWSVYVKTRKSSAFAPIYEQSTTGEDAHHRLHATVNNYPETDGFGHIYAVNYYAEFDARNGLMEYSFNPNGNSNDEQNNIKNSNRYKLVKNYRNPTGEKPKFTNQRRLAVAPDGKVYIADAGSSLAFDANASRPWMFKGGGVFVWNPNTQTGNEIQISLFTLEKTETSTAVDIYNHNGQLKLYATNTYGEFDNHYSKGNLWKTHQYTEANQANVNIYGWNGFKEYVLGTPNNVLMTETSGTELRSLGMGDGNGNIGIVATDKGIWMAQHRLNDVQYTIDVFKDNNSKKPALPDNTENYILSFVPYGSNTRTWRSCTSRGISYSGSTYDQAGASELTQLTTSPLQACPGAGLAYRKTNGKEFLYIVNHQGNIVELQITSWSGTTPSVKYIKTYPGSGPKEAFQNTGRLQGVINTMCFDYAGNLITTSGLEYLGSTSTQHIIVYTMPYDRVNAREIQAPNSCRMIPERIAHSDMTKENMDAVIGANVVKHPDGCAIDLYRPLQGGMFNTICLPFELNLGSLPADHPLKNAKLQAYTELKLETVGGEKMLELVFTDVNDNIIRANTPYIIRPENDEGINHIIRFAGPLQLTNTTGFYDTWFESGNTYSITYQGIIPYQRVEPTMVNGESLTLMLVAGNRLAEMTAPGDMYGFRGYFTLNTPLPRGMQTRITSSKDAPTNTTIVVDGKKVNVEKFLREGRVYIRVGETLYTINGEKVE